MLPTCPNCGRAVPLSKTLWGLGKPFRCQSCGEALVIPRNFTIPLLGIVLFFLLKPMVGDGLPLLALLLVLAALVQILTLLFLPVRRYE